MNKRKIGAAYEMQAAAYLKKKGYRILEANFRCRFGEIDLIARDGAYLVFIEVKYRSSLKDGDSLEAVNRRKQRKIIRVAEYYLCMYQEKADLPCRFDVIGIEEERIRLIRNAFDCGS
ncbi:YraN family protein [Fusicatenibacter faecihominis]|uniref:UPF0102 protein LKD71_03365 n=1 Tax=Fusicatenibacter faecihominis TaxID=2881276 RepID=A0AAE3DQQ7_9FIRM|nr:YraN family protein [Fusicatenibacter faecihominis]MCC2188870.1 YraN family protein [Fusicatenibacter faecihominis]